MVFWIYENHIYIYATSILRTRKWQLTYLWNISLDIIHLYSKGFEYLNLNYVFKANRKREKNIVSFSYFIFLRFSFIVVLWENCLSQVKNFQGYLAYNLWIMMFSIAHVHAHILKSVKRLPLFYSFITSI